MKTTPKSLVMMRDKPLPPSGFVVIRVGVDRDTPWRVGDKVYVQAVPR